MPSEGRPRAIDTATIGTPTDVPPASVTDMADRRDRHSARLAGAVTAWGTPEASDAIAALALGVAISRAVTQDQPLLIQEALRHGSTWDRIAAALDVSPADARALYATWSESLAPEEREEARHLADQ
ncbi:hypothetical protein TR51_22540 [Kitasatospora griseola]|uniref:Uncharacterized protein n=1 Tax=Kitasatospora griseola TaxID=2064 RepID=A0A0D0PTM8_KITGR|nr:hypothetical protein TR51_22540 [Kitasatospora griseola]